VIFAQQFGIDNIIHSDGFGISVTGICIVFAALILISLFIASLPHILASLAFVLPPEVEHQAAPAPGAPRNDHDEAVVAAIGFALHARQRKKK
jgi:oxaloacetate decarboxylase gamma subunit